MRIVSKEECISHYFWGSNVVDKRCSAWNLVDDPSLSVKLESMPPGSAEAFHFHHHAQQFFFVLRGLATINIFTQVVRLESHQGILIQPGEHHRVINTGNEVLEFILISQPSTANDRVNCQEIPT